MKRRIVELTGLLLLLGFLGLLVVASGIVPVKASSGHWPITRAFLSFAMRRSVETRSIGIKVPDVGDASWVLRGAGHYDRGCQPCHGAPGDSGSILMRELTPEPPYLPDVAPHWESAELFEIVKHGVKMTGMPAWPALQRDDEVWAMVAFLRVLPDLDSAAYRRLAWGETADTGESLGLGRTGALPAQVAATCSQCHGRHGLGRGVGAFPRIAGQKPAYLARTLQAYANGARHSGIMQPIAAELDEPTIRALARHYGAAEGMVPGARGADPALIARGERIAVQGIPARKIPSCSDCHGPRAGERNPNYPLLAGQYADYLALQLRLFREERRGGSEYADIMREAVHALEDDEADAVAAWFASLPWMSANRP